MPYTNSECQIRVSSFSRPLSFLFISFVELMQLLDDKSFNLIFDTPPPSPKHLNMGNVSTSLLHTT